MSNGVGLLIYVGQRTGEEVARFLRKIQLESSEQSDLCSKIRTGTEGRFSSSDFPR